MLANDRKAVTGWRIDGRFAMAAPTINAGLTGRAVCQDRPVDLKPDCRVLSIMLDGPRV
jgi:hypothetical protein